MKSRLIEDVVEVYKDAPQAQVEFKDENGVVHQGWAIAKPLNYDKECFSEEERKAMAQEVLDGHAFAVHFTEDEIALGEVPTLYKRHMEAKEMEKPEIKEDKGNAKERQPEKRTAEGSEGKQAPLEVSSEKGEEGDEAGKGIYENGTKQ